jgi:CRP-like cAMP-binding protein
MKVHLPFRQLDKGRTASTIEEANSQNSSHYFHTIQTSSECLLTMDLFADLQPEVIAAFERHAGERRYRKGTILYTPKERAEVLFLLKSGCVQTYRLTPTGKRLQLAVIKPGTFFGEMPLLGESLRDAYAEVVEDSVICFMNRSDVTQVMRERPEVALRMIEVLSRRYAMCQQRMEELAYRSLPTRIAAVLLRLSQEQHAEVVAITHKELGDMIGATREAVTKILDDFKRAGLVGLSRGCITLRDREGLQAWLEEFPGNA